MTSFAVSQANRLLESMQSEATAIVAAGALGAKLGDAPRGGDALRRARAMKSPCRCPRAG